MRYMSRHSWLIVAIAFAATPVQAAEETVFYCVVEQLLGIQSSKETSGKIKAPVERFTLKYKPAKIWDLPSSTAKKDPVYSVPQLATSFGNKNGAVGTYYYNDPISPFNLGVDASAALSESLFMRDDVSEKDRDKLREAVSESTQGPMTGAYMGSFNFFGINAIQIVSTDGGLNGVFYESSLYLPKDKKDTYRGFLSYVYQFSCQRF